MGMMLAEWGVPGDAAKAMSLLVNAESVATAHGYGTVQRRAGDALRRLDT